MVGVLALAAAVFLGGLTMTAGWIALFFVGGDEPHAKHAPADPVKVRAPGKRLLWLVFDAMRADAAFDPALMPNLAALRREGVWGVARTGSFTMTGTCVRALGTGVNPRPSHAIHNFRSPPITGDSLFRRVHRSGRRTVLIGDHIWVDLYRNTVRQSYPQPDLGINDLHRTDRAALADARRLLPGGWDLVVMHLVGSDHAAHKERSVRRGGAYRKKLAEYDRLIPELRRLMGADATLLVMADHGCNAVGNHGAGEPEATRAPYVLAGPGVLPAGRHDIDQRAFAPTITALLGVGTPWGAEVPGLLDGLALGDAERATVAYNHALGRRAHLHRIRGRADPALDRLLDKAARARAAGQHRAARRISVSAVRHATAQRLAHSRSSPWLWMAVLGLLLSLPLLLLAGGEALARAQARSTLPALVTLAASAGGIVSVFTLSARVSTPLCAALLVGMAVTWLLATRRLSILRWLPLGVAPFVLAVLGAWVLDWLKRLRQGDPTGPLWLALPGLVVLLAVLGWLLASGRLQKGLRDHPGLAAALAAAGLFLPLPFLRWWGGRHVVVALVGAALVLALLARAWWWRALTWRLAAGGGLLATSFVLGLTLGFGQGQGAELWLAGAIALGVPTLFLWIGGVRWRALLSLTGVAVLGAWAVAQLPRLGLNIPYVGFVGVSLGLAVLLWRRQGRGAHLALLSVALLRLLAVDQVVAATAILGAGVLGLASVRWRPRGLALAGIGVLMALMELVLFYQLGREFAFGTIDVRTGFVGGGEINLVRITILILLSNATPWWLMWSAAADLSPEPSWLDRLLVVQLWILAVKVLGTFLLFAGRPAHFWLIHSLIPFQFFGLANLLMIVTGYGLARSLSTFSRQASISSDESRVTL